MGNRNRQNKKVSVGLAVRTQMFSKPSALWWSEILSRTCWHFLFYQRRVFCKFLLNVSRVSLGQHQSCSSALWPLDSLSAKFCCQFSLRSASFPYFLYPDGPRLIRDTVADHTHMQRHKSTEKTGKQTKALQQFCSTRTSDKIVSTNPWFIWLVYFSCI